MKIKWLLLVGLALVAWWFFPKSVDQPGETPLTTERSKPLEQRQPPSAPPPTPAPSTQAPTPTEAVDLEAFRKELEATKLVSKETYRDEAKQDPHRVPPSLLASAARLGELIERIKSESQAREMINYLEACLKNDAPSSLEALCYRSAQSLSTTYPSLAPKVATFEPELSSQAKHILQQDSR